MKTKYPLIEPHLSGFLQVSEHHKIYWEESGNPSGVPVVFLHGGPGSGTEPGHRSFFDPVGYRIILFDQRGCGKSMPHASLEENTIWHLIADIEAIREMLGIKKWVVFGGSWGSTLALSYAIKHPDRVRALIVRGIFLGRKKELDWFYQSGAHYLFPDEFEKYAALIPEVERTDFIAAYYKRLTSQDPLTRKVAARVWSGWEAAALRLKFDPTLFSSFTEEHRADAIARIECHYFINRCFFPTDNWILEHIQNILHIPGVIIQGRYDIVCPMLSAWELHKAWPLAKFEIIADAGHAASEPGVADALIRATERFLAI